MTTTEQPESHKVDESTDLEETIAELRKQNEVFRKAIRSLRSEVSIMREQVRTARETMTAINNIRITNSEVNGE